MKSLFEMAGAFPKFNRIFLTCSEKLLKFMKDSCHADLIWMDFIVKYLLCHMDGVSDNNDFGNVFLVVYLVNTVSNGKELCFCASDKSCVVNHLNQRMVTYVNVQY